MVNFFHENSEIAKIYLTSEHKYNENIDFLVKNGTKDFSKNLELMIIGIQKLFTETGKIFKITSGYRTPMHNSKVGGAKLSLHTKCLAVDFYDSDGDLDEWFICLFLVTFSSRIKPIYSKMFSKAYNCYSN